MKKYTHIFFDLDHTLWDFERNSEEVLRELFVELGINTLGNFHFQDFIGHFRRIHHQLWDLYNHHQIDRQTIRSQRFELIRQALNVSENPIFEQLNEVYMELCPKKPHLMPYAAEILAYLAKKNYHLHIISNGFEGIQRVKMESSGILHYFSNIITSESSAARKPSKEIFDFALKESNARVQDALMIGDNLTTDIGGANNAGLDVIFYNPQKLTHKAKVTFEISDLAQIEDIL
jgi:putative hydrolase of the HAD superfamily